MLCELLPPVAEATDGGLKCFLWVIVKVISLECPRLLVVNNYEGSLSDGCHCIPYQLVLVPVVVEKYVAHMWKRHWSS